MTLELERRSSPAARALAPVLDVVGRDARDAGVPAAVAWPIALLPFVGGVLVAATVVHWPLFMWILREDHVIEWLQLALCLVTAGVAGLAAAGFARRREPVVAAVFVALCLGALVLGGEEISWGQRAFAFATPEHLAVANDQEEFNVHNLTEGGVDISQLFKGVELLMALGGGVLPLLTRRERTRSAAPLWRALSAPLFCVPLFAFAAAYRSLRFALQAAGNTPDSAVAFTEWAELMLYLGLAALATFAHASTRRRRGRHLPPGAGGGVAAATPLSAPVLVVTAVAGVVTVVLAVLTASSGVLPGNV